MTLNEIYLDNSATTKPYNDVIEIMLNYYKYDYGNPSSMHRMGINAEKGIKYARKEISNFLRVDESEILFTSGGTEGNNIAIIGAVNRNKRRGNHIITTMIEHPSVLNVFKHLENCGYEVTYLKVNKSGKISLEDLKSSIRQDTVLVSIMMVNNEVGTIQPIKDISKIVSQYRNCIFHVDGVQAFGKINCFPKQLGIDLFTISSHKIHGPKGIGALYINKDIIIEPVIFGGGQEGGLRSGTENVPAIVGLGKAVEIINKNFSENSKSLHSLRNKMIKKILDNIDKVDVNGPENIEEVAPHIISLTFANIKGEVLLHSLEQDNIYLSTGSACSSKRSGQSHVLKSMGFSNPMIDGTMRISLSILNTEEEIDTFVVSLKNHVNMLRKIIRR